MLSEAVRVFEVSHGLRTVRVWLPGTRLPGCADAAGGSTQLATGCGLDLVAADRENSAGPQRGVDAFPEITGDVLAAGLHIRDGAAAVLGVPGEFGLAIPDCATVCGEFRA